MIEIVEQVQEQLREPYEPVCRELGVPYSSLMRWRNRRQAGKALRRKPGPAKTTPLDFDALHGDILRLHFGRERTGGAGALHDKYRDAISRRDFHALVEAARHEVRQEEQALERRIDWLVPGVVWSMDDTEKHWLDSGFGHVHLVMDLGSRYNLRVLGADVQANGLEVALSLENLFSQYGAPLFMKMDGGSNFRHSVVRQLLADYGVIPLLSPPYYPPYNGSIERGHQEILWLLTTRIGGQKVTARELRLECEVSGHEVNHKRRRSLGWRTACRALDARGPVLSLFGRRERKGVFDELQALTVDIAQQLDQHTDAVAETAFRYAAETWMQSNHMIRVTRNGEVLPLFYQFRSH
jgi:transposase InsO family protein